LSPKWAREFYLDRPLAADYNVARVTTRRIAAWSARVKARGVALSQFTQNCGSDFILGQWPDTRLESPRGSDRLAGIDVPQHIREVRDQLDRFDGVTKS